MKDYNLNEIKALIEKGYYVHEIANELQLNSKSITNRKNPFYSIKWRNKVDPLAIGRWIYQESNNLRGDRKFSIWNKYYQENNGSSNSRRHTR